MIAGARMGHDSWIAIARRIESAPRTETSRELIADAGWFGGITLLDSF